MDDTTVLATSDEKRSVEVMNYYILNTFEDRMNDAKNENITLGIVEAEETRFLRKGMKL